MERNRYEQGIQKLAEIDGTVGENVIASLQNVAPDLGKYIIEFAGNYYSSLILAISALVCFENESRRVELDIVC